MYKIYVVQFFYPVWTPWAHPFISAGCQASMLHWNLNGWYLLLNPKREVFYCVGSDISPALEAFPHSQPHLISWRTDSGRGSEEGDPFAAPSSTSTKAGTATTAGSSNPSGRNKVLVSQVNYPNSLSNPSWVQEQFVTRSKNHMLIK